MRKQGIPIMLFVFLTFFVFQFVLSAHNVKAVLPLPRGQYDEGFWYNGIHDGWFYDGGPNITWDSGMSASFGYEVTSNSQINTNYLELSIPVGRTSYAHIKIPSDDVDYIFICYRLYAYEDGYTGESSTTELYLSYNNSNVKNIDKVSASWGNPVADTHYKCSIVNIQSFTYPHSEYEITLKEFLPDSGGLSTWARLYSIQFLNSSFEPVNPVDNLIKVYNSDYLHSSLDDIYDPFTNYGIETGSIDNITYNKVFYGSDYNILQSSENYWKNFTIESSGANEFWASPNPSTIYHNVGWSTDTNLNNYLVMADIYQKSGTYDSPNSMFRFIIRQLLNSTYVNGYTEFDLNRSSNTLDYYLMDHDRNILKATTGVSFSIPSNPFRLIFYKPPYQISNTSYLMLVSHSTSLSVVNVIGIPNDYVVSSNTQTFDFDMSSSTEIDLSTYKYYYETYQEYIPPPTGASISWTSTNVSTQEIDNFTISWTGGEPPFNITMKISGPYYTESNVTVSSSPYSSNIQFGYAGDYDTYAIITDSEGRSIETNHVTVHVYNPPSPINDYHTVINGQEGRPYGTVNTTVEYGDTLNITVYNITGGDPPYTVEIENIVTGSTWTEETSGTNVTFNIPVASSDFQCVSGSVTTLSNGTRICDNTLYTIVTDSSNNVKSEGPHYVYLSAPPPGGALNVTLRISPSENLTTRTPTSVFINISGGQPPYHVTLLDSYRTVCDDTIDYRTYNLLIYWYGGTHNVEASVSSSDGQDAVSDTYEFDVTPYNDWYCVYHYNSSCTVYDRVKNYVIGCGGTLGEGSTDNEQESVLTGGGISVNYTWNYTNMTQPMPGVNVTEWEEAGFGWALFLFSPIFWGLMISVIISGGASAVFGGEQKGLVFSIVFLVMIMILTIFQVLPVWAGVVMIIISAGIVAVFVRNMF